MSQISRPFQIALLAMGLLVAVWFVALRGHSTATSGQGSSASAPASPPATASAPASASASASSGGTPVEKSAAPTPVYGGSAPGVAGLSRAIAKAHGAVAESQQNAKQLAEKSAQASSSASVAGGSAEATASSKQSATPTTSSPATAAPKVSVTTVRTPAPAAKRVTGPNRVPARQVLVEQALKQGAVAVVLFWDPRGSDDVAVHRELQLLKAVHQSIRSVANVPEVSRLLKAAGLELNRKIAVQEALASQVASFGSITRSVHVAGTPTILIINKRGQTTTMTGLTDAYAIEQAIDEARKA